MTGMDDGRVILVTAFGPYGPYRKNPTEEIVRRLLEGGECGGPLPGVEGVVLPVSREKAPAVLMERLRRGGLRAVLLLGLAPDRPVLTLERFATNLLDYPIPDEEGAQVREEPVLPGGPVAYESTLPLRAIQEALLAEGIPCGLSATAGSYLCNQMLYLALHEAAVSGSGVPTGFLHIPRAAESVAEQMAEGKPGAASLPLATLERGLRRALEVLVGPGV